VYPGQTQNDRANNNLSPKPSCKSQQNVGIYIWREWHASDLFPIFSADTLDGERLAEETLSQCAGLGANVEVSGQKPWRFQVIYYYAGASTELGNCCFAFHRASASL